MEATTKKRKNDDDDGDKRRDRRLFVDYIRTTRLVEHQIKPFDRFVLEDMQQIVNRENAIWFGDRHTLKLEAVRLCRPSTEDYATDALRAADAINDDDARRVRPMTPDEARLRNMTYDGELLLSVSVAGMNAAAAAAAARTTTRYFNDVPVGRVPVMLASCLSNESVGEECEYDPGGYFVIKGKERVIIGQLRPAYNRVYVSVAPKGQDVKFTHVAEIRSMNEQGNSVVVVAKIVQSKHISFSLPYLKALIPAGVVFRALGADDADDVYASIGLSSRRADHVARLRSQMDLVADERTSIDYIVRALNGSHDADFIENILCNELFYHVGALTKRKSITQLAYICKRLIDVVDGRCVVDDRCTLAARRIDSAGALMASQFQGLLKKYIKLLARQIRVEWSRLTQPSSTKESSFVGGGGGPPPAKYVVSLSDNMNAVAVICNNLKAIMREIGGITSGFATVFSTGNWVVNSQISPNAASSAYARIGVSQVLSNQNFASRLSHLRRETLPTGAKCRKSDARRLHSSHFGYNDPFETPEGETVGLVLNLAMGCEISLGVPTHDILAVVPTLLGRDEATAVDDDVCRRTLVIVNGYILGCCVDARRFVGAFNACRRNESIDDHVSIAWLRYSNEIHIQSDNGRYIRPLYALQQQQRQHHERADDDDRPSLETFDDSREGRIWCDAVRAGVVVFRDPAELEESVVAIDRAALRRSRCDYMEVCAAGAMFGTMAASIPFANHCQSPRIAYQASMGKQAIGIPMLSYRRRFDTSMNVLDYPQRPLTTPVWHLAMRADELPATSMPVVAVMTFLGFNQEDSIALSKSSIDLGLFGAMTYKTVVDEQRKQSANEYEVVALPDYRIRRREYNYSHLKGGAAVIKYEPGLRLRVNDVLVAKVCYSAKRVGGGGGGARGKLTTTTSGGGGVDATTVSELARDCSLVVKSGEEGMLDAVYETKNGDGMRLIKIRIRNARLPEIGDKFASLTAQKGTCGIIVAKEDLPFDAATGMTPDLLINPHAFPSRMTINMLIEMGMNLVACATGVRQDATAFDDDDVHATLTDAMRALGWESFATTMICGITGRQFATQKFMAPVAYQRLKHMVDDKMHARTTGPVDSMTHQPLGGRSRDGGLKFGEMERDAQAAHGATRVMVENLYDQSDKYVVDVCADCGLISGCDRCVACDGSSRGIERVAMPYVTKQMCSLLNARGMRTKFNLESPAAAAAAAEAS